MLWPLIFFSVSAGLWIGIARALIGVKRDQIERERSGLAPVPGESLRRFLRHLFVPVGLLAVATGLFYLILVPKARYSEWRYERKVARAVPIGSSREQAESWLRSQGRVVYDEEPCPFDQIDCTDAERGRYSGVSIALVEHTDYSLFVIGGVEIFILYDQEGRVARHLVDWYGTGP